MEKKDFLTLDHISKTFPGVKALDDIHLSIRTGEVHALVGENGAGKSTLIKIMSGVLKPDPGGFIRVEGRNVKLNDINESIHNGISVIYQDLCLFPNLSVAENICIGRQLEGTRLIRWKNYRQLADKVLGRMHINIDPDATLGNLSIASQQLVAITRAIAFNARLIIMDEPTSSLSRSEVDALFDIILSLKREGIGILFISHKLDEVMRISDTVSVLRDGKYVGTEPASDLSEREIIQMMVGRTIEYIKLNEQSASTGKPVLEVQHISKKGHYKDISFKVCGGEIVGITGLVGAGRTEVIKSLFGLLSVQHGKIILEGREINVRSTSEAKKLGISYIPEDRQHEGLIMKFNINGNVNLVNYLDTIGPFGLLKKKKILKISEALVEKMDVRPKDIYRSVMEFSGGNQQKIVLGKWLATRPKVLIVDEPTYGVDIGSKVELHKLLRSLATEGIAIIVVSSELQEVLTLTDRVLVMRRGRLVAQMSAAEATQEKVMEYALLSKKKEAAQ